MNLKIYKPEIRCETKSVFGNRTEHYQHDDERLKTLPVVQAFLADDDLQDMRVCSTNIGFVKTFTKEYVREVI